MTDFNSLVSLKAAAMTTQTTALAAVGSARCAFCNALKAWGLHDDLQKTLSRRPINFPSGVPEGVVTPGTPDLDALALSYQTTLVDYNTATDAVTAASAALNAALATAGA